MPASSRSSIQSYHLKNRTVVITGASSGAGRAAAMAFARYGATLVLAARNIAALEDVEQMCRQLNVQALAVRADVTDAQQMEELAAIAAEFGNGIDVWVNNAGVLATGVFDETPVEVHEQVIATNLVGYLHGAHAVLPYFKQQGHGILINNTSIGGWFPVPYGAAYSASKFGIRALMAALRSELSDYPGIRICDMYPAFLDTPGTQHAANFTGKTIVPAPPLIDPQAIAQTMVNLAMRPRRATYVGLPSRLMKLAYLAFPGLSMAITKRVVQRYLKTAPDSSPTTGNLFEPLPFGTSIHGGWSLPADAVQQRKWTIGAVAVAGVAAALSFAFFKRKSCRS